MTVRQYLKSVFPPAWHFRLLELKKRLTLSSYQTKTYSGDGEDILLAKLFTNKPNGVYVDVGCFHPKLISNTYLLHKRGWRGLNIDPNPEVIQLFKRYRPQDTSLQVGVAKTVGPKTYYNFTHPGVNTFANEHAEEKGSKTWNTLVNTSEIPCRPLADILAEHVPEQPIDVLDVDVEGMDLEVLESNDWDRFQPTVVLVEDRDFRTQLTDSPVYQFLVARNYRFHAYNNITLVMVRSDQSTRTQLATPE